jgi:hypothetical protein
MACESHEIPTQLQALFDEEAIDFLLNVFDHLNVRVLIRVCAVSCRRAREVLWPPYYPQPRILSSLLSAPWRDPVWCMHRGGDAAHRHAGVEHRFCGCGIRGERRF